MGLAFHVMGAVGASLPAMLVRELASTPQNATAAKGLVSSRDQRRSVFVALEPDSTMERLVQNAWGPGISRRH